MEDWKDFFTKTLLDSRCFSLSHSFTKGGTDIEIYSALKGNPDTTIEVGYFSPMTLIYLHIFNPATPAKNKQQEIEHFYKYEFDSEKQYGAPGLEYNETNVRGINSYLSQPFSGKEIVYYKNGRPVMSRLTTSYYPDSPNTTMIYRFENESLLQRIKTKFFGAKTEYDEIKVVDLETVYCGLDNMKN